MSLRFLTPIPTTGAAPFDPNSIANLIRYWNPALGLTHDGSNNITAWVDQSTTGDTLTPSGNSLVYSSNAFGTTLPGAVGTNANNTKMAFGTAISSATAFTVFAVLKPATPTAASQVVLSSLATNDNILGIYNATTTPLLQALNHTPSNYAEWNPVYSTGTSYLFTINSGSGPTTAAFYLNNVLKTQLDNSGNTSWAMNTNCLGGYPVSGRCFDGAIGPVLIYSRALTTTEMTQVYTWLHGAGWI